MKEVKLYQATIKAIREYMDPAEFGRNLHFVRSKKGDLLIRFNRNREIEKGLVRVRDKLFSLGPEVVRRVVSL